MEMSIGPCILRNYNLVSTAAIDRVIYQQQHQLSPIPFCLWLRTLFTLRGVIFLTKLIMLFVHSYIYMHPPNFINFIEQFSFNLCTKRELGHIYLSKIVIPCYLKMDSSHLTSSPVTHLPGFLHKNCNILFPEFLFCYKSKLALISNTKQALQPYLIHISKRSRPLPSSSLAIALPTAPPLNLSLVPP